MRMINPMSAVLAAAAMMSFATAGNPSVIAEPVPAKRKRRRTPKRMAGSAMHSRSELSIRFRDWMREKPGGKAALRRARQHETREIRDGYIAAGFGRNRARRMAWAATHGGAS
jgi:hypothetical protein